MGHRNGADEAPAIPVAGLERHGYCNTSPGVDLYYALFGKGSVKVVLLMGIATSGLAWKNQIEYFMKFPQFQVVAVDNRGSGRTAAPRGRITTKQMAQDVIELLKFLEWDKMKVHLVGNSLGGMIAQEFALAVPQQVATLTLISTHSGGPRAFVPPISAMLSLARHAFAKGDREQARILLETVFSTRHLNKPGRKEHLSIIHKEFPTILDFYVHSFTEQYTQIFAKEHAVSLFLQQFSAVLTHYVSNKRLRSLRNKFPILVMVGTGDKIVHPSNSFKLAATLDAEMLEFPDAGHALTEECLDHINCALKDHFTRSMN
jgi:pimeloyl-ACP methyl ester carboxylesterase